jgi:hypothetical protein
VRYIINVKYLEEGISSSGEKKAWGGFIKDIVIFDLD